MLVTEAIATRVNKRPQEKFHVSIALIVIIFIMVIAVHIIAGVGVFHQGTILTPDAKGYDRLAWNMLQTGHFSMAIHPGDAATQLNSTRTPGYPLFLMLIFAVFGHHYLAVMVIQSLLLVLLMVLVYHVTAKLAPHPWPLVASLLIGFCPQFITQTKLLQCDTLNAVLIFSAVALLLDGPNTRKLLLSGLLLGFAFLVRPAGILILIPITIWLLWRYYRKKECSILLILLWGILAIIGPLAWMARNHSTFGSWGICTQPDIQLLEYDAFYVTSMHNQERQGRSLHSFLLKDNESLRRELPAKRWITELQQVNAPVWLVAQESARLKVPSLLSPAPQNEYTKNKQYGTVAMAVLGSLPHEWAICILNGWVHFWFPARGACYEAGPYDASAKYRRLTDSVALLSWLLIVVAGVWGLLRSLKNKERCEQGLMLLSVIFLTMFVVLSVGYFRYRMAIEPFLAVYAAYAFSMLKNVKQPAES